MIHFKLDSNWKILSVIRCSNSHATLSVQQTQVANRFTEMQGVINLYQALGGGRD